MTLSDTGFTGFSGSLGPLTRITPFTHRDNATYLRILQEIIEYINSTLVNEVDVSLEAVLIQFTEKADELALIITEAETGIATSKAAWQVLFDEFMADVVAQIALLNDSAVKDLLNNAASLTGIAARALFYTKTQTDTALTLKAEKFGSAEYSAPGDYTVTGNKPVKLGVVLDVGIDGAFDDNLVESLTVIKDPESGRLAGTYVGYNDDGGILTASIGLAYSDDGIRWDKAGVLLDGSGIPGQGDFSGCSGPLLVLHEGVYHLFYIGLTAPGYEGGARSLMLATTPSLKTPVWTRYGVVMDAAGTGWRSVDVWHPSIVRKDSTWYCFINASGLVDAEERERIGFATADDLTGPWLFDDVNSPVMDSGQSITGDPCVTKVPGGWRMDYFATTSDGKASDYYTTTTDAEFPLGWLIHDGNRRSIQAGPAGAFDELYAHKPFILNYGGRLLHYYTAVMAGNTERSIAVAVSGGNLPVKGETKENGTTKNVGTFVQVRSGALDTTYPVTTAWAIAMQGAAVVQARAGDLLEFTLGYACNDGVGDLRVDVVALNQGVPATYVSGTEHGITGWGSIGGRFENGGGTYHYKVKATDIHRDTVTLAPVFRALVGARSVFSSVEDPIEFSVRNLG